MLNISGIHEGFVLDHIKAGMSLQIYHDLKLDEFQSARFYNVYEGARISAARKSAHCL